MLNKKGCSYCNGLSEDTDNNGIESVEKDLRLSDIPSEVLAEDFQPITP